MTAPLAAWPLRRWIAPAALGLALLSLLLNAVLLWQLRRPERFVAPAVERLATRLGAEAGVIRYDVRIPVGTPLALDIPIDERFSVAVDTTIPLNTTVRVPIRGPLGTAYVNVPIRANVPLRTRLPLEIRHTFRLRTRTTQTISVPIQIRLDELLGP